MRARRGQGTYGAFISHFKREAQAEARDLKTRLEKHLKCRVFLDSDDLQDLRTLLAHVANSNVLVLLQTRSVLERPWCFLEARPHSARTL